MSKHHLDQETVGKHIREVARAEAYHRGAFLQFEHIATRFPAIRARFICEQAELAGFPVWVSAPDEALKP